MSVLFNYVTDLISDFTQNAQSKLLACWYAKINHFLRRSFHLNTFSLSIYGDGILSPL